MESEGLVICLISVHGLIRSSDLELGRDSDCGGQIVYVVELARALASQPGVRRVDLLTRKVEDSSVSRDYAEPIEPLSDKARIVRIEAGPEGYIPKEKLWDHLDGFVDNSLNYLRQQDKLPDIIHTHYADAGYVGCRLSHMLGVPLVHTGHSLGRVKRRRLIASGLNVDEIEESYNMTRRIEAEEMTLASAELVITSTNQEIEEQYERYDYYRPEQMLVIPPGTDLQRFHPPLGDECMADVSEAIKRFLKCPQKPMILALSRPDPRKNITALVTAFGQDKQLQRMANLVIVAGNRDDVHDLDTGSREVWTELLLLIDCYDLYGKVAYPKHHTSNEVPLIYRLATAGRGVFVNPALTEPFGLTLIEAAASGLPIVATEDGGPRDIIGNCRNGSLIDPLDPECIAAKLKEVLASDELWQERSVNGLKGVREHYSWDAHATSYLEKIRPIIKKTPRAVLRAPGDKLRLQINDRAIFTDIDQNLLADPESLPRLIRLLKDKSKTASFGIATGRRLDSALKVMKKYGIPEPDVLITSAGTAIHYAPKLNEDANWSRIIERQWMPQVVTRVLKHLPGLVRQSKMEQSRFKLSYYYDPEKALPVDEIIRLLHQEEQSVNVTVSFGQFLDITPICASKGLALRYVAGRWNMPLERILAAGGSGADEDMMRGNTLAVVVGNRHHEELSQLTENESIYFSSAPGAGGIIEAIEHYDFFNI